MADTQPNDLAGNTSSDSTTTSSNDADSNSSADTATASGTNTSTADETTPEVTAGDEDHVELLQELVSRHVELFERLIYVELDINQKNNINRIGGDQSQGLISRLPADMQQNLPVDRHWKSLERALKESDTLKTIQTDIFSNGTIVRGPAKSIQQMVETLSHNTFDDLLKNGDEVLAALDQIDFAVCPCL